jgi:hypothetical protein
MQKVLALVSLRACTVLSGASALALSPQRMQATASYHNDVSRPLREVAATYKPGRLRNARPLKIQRSRPPSSSKRTEAQPFQSKMKEGTN